MTKTFKTLLLASGMTLGLTGAAHADHVAYSLGNGGGSLVNFGAGTPDDTAGVDITVDGDSLSLDAITFRPETGQLYGYSAQTDSFYTVDPMTGAATLEFTADIDLPGGNVSLDFNPTLDAVRLVTANRDNIVYFPGDSRTTANQGVLTTAPTDLFYDDGYDQNGNAPVQVVGNGYTNQIGFDEAQATGTTQYVLDARTDSIGILNNNAGDVDFVSFAMLDTDGDGVGDEELSFNVVGGFDVFTAPDGTNIGYALLSGAGQGGSAFYELDLGTFVFSLIGEVDENSFGQLRSLAVFLPMMDADAVPIPAAALLFPLGAAGIAAARKRKIQA